MKMADFSNLEFNRRLIRWRWSIAASISALVLILEVAVRRQNERVANPENFYLELLLFAITLPLLFGISLSMLKARSELVNTISRYDRLRGTRLHLRNARDWDEMATILLQIPRAEIPLVGDALMIYNQKTGAFERVTSWSRAGWKLPPPVPSMSSESCTLCMEQALESPRTCIPCCCLPADGTCYPSTIFCLPIGHSRHWSGLLILYLEPGVMPKPDQIQPLIELSLDIDLNIERLQLRQIILGEISAADVERRRLAHYLHDTLAHNIAFLRLKLEQLSGIDKIYSSSTIHRDLDQMLEIANQSYGQVRNLLTNLMDESAKDFVASLTECATMIAVRANFEVEISQDGPPKKLAPHIQRQILYIARELLRNVEKHAHAEKVHIVLKWQKNSIAMTFLDNGQGFDLSVLEEKNGSHGLHIIEEYTQELNGLFTLTTSPAAGTQVNLWFPLVPTPVNL